MTRSVRKTPIYGITNARSERKDKQQWHRRFRVLEKQRLHTLTSETMDNHVTTSIEEVSNPWAMNKDGRQYWSWSSQKRAAIRMAKKKMNAEEIQPTIQRLVHRWKGK
jgi:hypothetical protein